MIVFDKYVPFTWYKAGLCAFVGLAVIFLHRANIGRLVRGEEKKFTYKKKSEIKEERKNKETEPDETEEK
ncbi:unknown [Acidiphilium sp. CAG:727]|nr:unknown [Acidiphilium sp. CAG:727]